MAGQAATTSMEEVGDSKPVFGCKQSDRGKLGSFVAAVGGTGQRGDETGRTHRALGVIEPSQHRTVGLGLGRKTEQTLLNEFLDDLLAHRSIETLVVTKARGGTDHVCLALGQDGILNAMGPQQRRREILAEIARLGVVLPGSLVARSTCCQSSGCRCHGDPPRLHGLYPTWMRQDGDHQVTRTLKAENAERLQPLLAADRRLRQLVKELEALGVSEVDDLLG